MKKITKVFIITIISLSILRCDSNTSTSITINGWDDFEVVKGNGKVVTEPRSISKFDQLTVSGSIEVNGIIGKETKLSITGDDNLIALIETKVENGSLVITSMKSYTTNHPIKIDLVTPEMRRINTKGSSDVKFSGLNATVMTVDSAGSSDIILSCEVGGLNVWAKGSAKIKAKDCKADKARVAISGSGKATVNVKTALRVDIKGSGKVLYHGNPSLSKSIKGSGSIKQIKE
jgi:hypothetical protein